MQSLRENKRGYSRRQSNYKAINKTIKIAIILLIITLNFSSPFLAKSSELKRIPLKATEKTATIELEAPTKVATSSQTFNLNINVNPGGQAINAVGIFLNFATSSLIATNIDTQNSFCDFFIDSSIHQKTGQINILCGKPYPGIATTSNVAKITFIKNTPTLSNIKIQKNSLVLANDGFGTNILKDFDDIDVLIK